MSMNLPEGVKKFNNARKFREEVQKLEVVESRMEKFRERIEATTSTTTTVAPKVLISNRVSDVEYDDDFVEEKLVEDRFNEIPTMALRNEAHKYELPEIRDFSIDLWNGSPGLKYWGYNESKHTE